MNLILVDMDCENRVTDEELKQLFPDSTIKNLVISNETSANRYHLEEMERERFGHCVLLTALSGGIKNYHRELILHNQNCSNWIISILDVEHQNYKRQFMNHLDQMLGKADVPYEVLFDSSGDLSSTAQQCAVFVGDKPKCVIASHKEQLITQTKELIQKIFSGWDILFCLEPDNDNCRFARCILLLGNEPDDFSFLPSDIVGLNRIYLWCLRDSYDLRGVKQNHLTDRICRVMFSEGWNFSDLSSRVFVGDLSMEKFRQDIQAGDYSPIALNNDDNFVMQDEFGLPVARKLYDEERIRSYLEEYSVFAKITGLLPIIK